MVQVLYRDERFSFPITGRLSLGRYDLLIVSPATANTVAKIVHGIADTLVTNAVAQAGKGKVRTIIVPVDLEEGEVETVIPSKLELSICRRCETCNAAAACPQDAIIPGVEIQLLKCIGCGNCQRACPYGAISGGSTITLHMRNIDVDNTRRLKRIDGIQVIKEPVEFWDHL